MWTNEDQEEALKEGWGVFHNSDYGEKIERYDEAERFDSDAAAAAYVGIRAILGDELATKAIYHLGNHYAVTDAAELDQAMAPRHGKIT